MQRETKNDEDFEGIIEMVRAGRTDRDIAEAFGYSPGTVSAYVVRLRKERGLVEVPYRSGLCTGCMEAKTALPQPLPLQFRVKLPNGRYFCQKNQYLISFFRRATSFITNSFFKKEDKAAGVHESYLDKPLEEYLEIKIGEDWVPCTFKAE